jgi:hypothetical protein
LHVLQIPSDSCKQLERCKRGWDVMVPNGTRVEDVIKDKLSRGREESKKETKYMRINGLMG